MKLDQEKLRILLIVSEFDGIGAKALGQKIHLSRSAALAQAKQLIKLNLLTSERLSSRKTGIKPAYSFHLASGVTKEVVEAALNPVTEKSFQQQSSFTLADDIQEIPNLLETVQELIAFYRKIKHLEETLRMIEGEKAEKLISTLRAENFKTTD